MNDRPDRLQRRALLLTAPNPDARLDSVVTLGGRVAEGASIRLRYVPDRLVLDATAFGRYLNAVPAVASLEALAAAILADVNDQAVPRWVEVAATASHEDHAVLISDRQPKWDNPALLARLDRH